MNNEQTAQPTLAPFVFYMSTSWIIEEMGGSIKVEDVTIKRPGLRHPTDEEIAAGCEDAMVPCDEEEEYQRVTLYSVPGARRITHIAVGTGRVPTEEGWSLSGITVREDSDTDGLPFWSYERTSDGADCDGRLSSTWDGYSDGTPDPDAPAYMADRSNLIKKGSGQRDYAAEAAGY
jgi:hypothetical protein